jgi:hypothetical protein
LTLPHLITFKVIHSDRQRFLAFVMLFRYRHTVTEARDTDLSAHAPESLIKTTTGVAMVFAQALDSRWNAFVCFFDPGHTAARCAYDRSESIRSTESVNQSNDRSIDRSIISCEPCANEPSRFPVVLRHPVRLTSRHVQLK